MSEHPSLLVLVIDVSPREWELRRRRIQEQSEGEAKLVDFEEMLRACMVFVNAYVLMHRHNQLCVIVNHPRQSKIIHPLPGQPFVPSGHEIDSIIEQGVHAVLSGADEADQAGGHEERKPPRWSSLAQALSLGLCVCNKQLKALPRLMPRFLVVQLCKDQAEQYNSVMNCIFAAQGLGIPIDCCVLALDQSTMLQQAAYLTGGVYITPVTSGRCLQQMMMHCLPSTETRKLLKSMVPMEVDFRASCLCHRRRIDTAFMCSVCLSVFCERLDRCTTCGTPTRHAASAQGNGAAEATSNS